MKELKDHAGGKTSLLNDRTNSDISLHYVKRPDLCKQCEVLVGDVLGDSQIPSAGWRIVDKASERVFIYNDHYGGSIAKLKQSADSGCGFCRRMVHALHIAGDDEFNKHFTIFHHKSHLPKLKIDLAVGKDHDLLSHASTRVPSETIVLYTRQRGHQGISLTELRLPPGSLAPRLYLAANPEPASDDSFNLAEQWMRACLKEHPRCNRASSELPDRLLKLGKEPDLSGLRLYLTDKEQESHIEYAILSYSWGDDESRWVMTKNLADLRSYCQGIDARTLPKTLFDFLYVAKRLRFDYVWIDALCIIQLDPIDFALQVMKLSDIYGRSALNVSATSSRHCDQGFLQPLLIPDSDLWLGQLLRPKSSTRETAVWAGPQADILDLDQEFISSRGWVFQERLVTCATLHYTDKGLVWECASGRKVGHDSGLDQKDWKREWQDFMGRMSPASPNRNLKQRRVSLQNWYNWVSAYSRRNLYKSTDKFLAIAGLARTFADIFSLNYAAGLWKEDIVHGLMWRRDIWEQHPIRYVEHVAPSWSWASVRGHLEYRKHLLTASTNGPLLDINCQDVQVQEETEGTFGRVTEGGSIRAKGYLQEIVVDTTFHSSGKTKEYHPCGVRYGFANVSNVLVTLDLWEGQPNEKFSCFCLRLGSFDSTGRIGDVFLLLEEKTDRCGSDRTFSRIGLAETSPWEDFFCPTPDSGRLTQPDLTEVVLI